MYNQAACDIDHTVLPWGAFSTERIRPLMCDIINFQLKQGFSSNKYSIASSNTTAQFPLSMPVPTVLCKYTDLIWIFNASEMNVS